MGELKKCFALCAVILFASGFLQCQDTLLIRKSYRERKVEVNKTFNLNKEIPSMALLFISGAADGFGDVLQFHYREFEQVFPNANEQWFNPELSWRNKYKNGDPSQGRRYPGSISVFVAGTDAWHATKLTRLTTLTASLAIAPVQVVDPTSSGYKRHKGLKKFLTKIFAYSASYHLGQFLVYDVIFSDKR